MGKHYRFISTMLLMLGASLAGCSGSNEGEKGAVEVERVELPLDELTTRCAAAAERFAIAAASTSEETAKSTRYQRELAKNLEEKCVTDGAVPFIECVEQASGTWDLLECGTYSPTA